MSDPPRRSASLPIWVAAGLCVLGAVILTLTSWQWRGLIGWGLGAAGVVLLIVVVTRRGSREGADSLMRRWVQTALAAPAVSDLLILAASIGNIGVPYPAMMGFLVLFLTTPLIAGLLLWSMGASTKTIVAVAVVSVTRWVVFLVSVRDPFAYYAWPADVVLSIVLLVIALQVGRSTTTAVSLHV